MAILPFSVNCCWFKLNHLSCDYFYIWLCTEGPQQNTNSLNFPTVRECSPLLFREMWRSNIVVQLIESMQIARGVSLSHCQQCRQYSTAILTAKILFISSSREFASLHTISIQMQKQWSHKILLIESLQLSWHHNPKNRNHILKTSVLFFLYISIILQWWEVFPPHREKQSISSLP